MRAEMVWPMAVCSVFALVGVGIWLIHGMEKEEMMIWNFE